MEKNSSKVQKIFYSEEENILDWTEVQLSLEKNFGKEIFNSWLKNLSLVKEYNDHIVLGAPTRFFRDWIVSRYLDKILEHVKVYKKSLSRIEFKILEDPKSFLDGKNSKIDIGKVSEIKDSVLKL